MKTMSAWHCINDETTLHKCDVPAGFVSRNNLYTLLVTNVDKNHLHIRLTNHCATYHSVKAYHVKINEHFHTLWIMDTFRPLLLPPVPIGLFSKGRELVPLG